MKDFISTDIDIMSDYLFELRKPQEDINYNPELKEEYAEYCHPLDAEQLYDRGVQMTVDEFIANGATRSDVIHFVKALFGHDISRKEILSSMQKARDPQRNYFIEPHNKFFQPFDLDDLRERGLQFTADQLIANGMCGHCVSQVAEALFGEEIGKEKIQEAIDSARDKAKNVLLFNFQS